MSVSWLTSKAVEQTGNTKKQGPQCKGLSDHDLSSADGAKKKVLHDHNIVTVFHFSSGKSGT